MSDGVIEFNKSLSGARVVVEPAFGLLKGRWRCLLDTLDESAPKVFSTVITCCIIHNRYKYKDFEIEINRVWDMQRETITVVIGALGLISKGLDNVTSRIPGNINTIEIQKITGHRITDILRKVMSPK